MVRLALRVLQLMVALYGHILTFVPLLLQDLFINGFGIFTNAAGAKIAWFIDPLGAILISLAIITSWSWTAFSGLPVPSIAASIAHEEVSADYLFVSRRHQQRSSRPLLDARPTRISSASLSTRQ